MSPSSNSSEIYLYIDTGGTFTDTIATDPDGNIINRVKVLSSSALRGLGRRVDESILDIEIYENIDLADDFFEGYQLKFSEFPDQTFQVISSKKNRLSLDLEIPGKLTKERTFPVEIKSPEEAPVLAARLITNTPLKKTLPPLQLRLSTTKGTNALLERQGASTLFLITEGFKDLLRIKNQQRPDLFSLNIRKPEPYAGTIVEVPERLDADGNVLK